ncbi:trypsin-like peptidase domain-containing protein [Oculatella sp. LEGE 06141]|uniref:S1C family serine protease n=1 Tax=Oculatella sp. LEGE 06141 TaxID=1828648 RepID=UPI001882382A|nr:trypsin-like peptidase domain-containing protein [Oculatella sp. LEGE 06141]MBE9181053.1 trypsin-like peptidase domain-containing protein [Oculatella sp. LEGE 06141]
MTLSQTVDQELAALAETLRRSTVQIQGRRSGVGSGIIWHSDGLIVTNAHVLRGKRAIATLADGRSFEARVIATDWQRDLASLVINASGLPAVAVADSRQIRVGELVFAVGNPLGVTGVLTTGIVHAMPSSKPFNRRSWIQANLRLAPGNSGGPLANAQGQVIGVNSMIVDGRAFAIPSQTVERFLSSRDRRPYLGITLQPVLVPWQGDRYLGWLALEISPNSPADVGGLLPGDVLVGINEQRFQTSEDLAFILSEANPGDALSLDLVRSGQMTALTLVVGHHGGAKAA